MLTFKSLLNNAKSLAEKIFVKIKNRRYVKYCFSPNCFFKFERQLHFKRSKEELTDEQICEIWMSTQKESLECSRFRKKL